MSVKPGLVVVKRRMSCCRSHPLPSRWACHPLYTSSKSCVSRPATTPANTTGRGLAGMVLPLNTSRYPSICQTNSAFCAQDSCVPQSANPGGQRPQRPVSSTISCLHCRLRSQQQSAITLWNPPSRPLHPTQSSINRYLLSKHNRNPFYSISCVIPPELKAIIASHALLAPIGAPTVLEIPKKFTLFYTSPRPDLIHIEQLSSLSIFQTRTDLANAISAAVASGIRSLPHDSECSISSLSATTCSTIGNLYLSSCPGKKGPFFPISHWHNSRHHACSETGRTCQRSLWRLQGSQCRHCKNGASRRILYNLASIVIPMLCPILMHQLAVLTTTNSNS